MKKLWLLLFVSSLASAAYSPGVFLADPSTPTQRASVDSSGNLSVKASSWPLPTGSATSANQGTMITDLGNISGQLPATLGQKTMAASLACTLASDQSAIPVTGAFWQATQPVSIAASVQVKSPLNSTGSGSAAAATVSTVITLTAPANAVGAFLMNLDTSTANIRWSVNRTATTTLGQQLQPGRDVWIPTSHDISLVSESGTQNYDVQWISQ